MSLLESGWFLVTFLIIAIILTVDPKNSTTGSNPVASLGIFSSPSSGQNFIYRLSAILIAIFFVLTTVLSFIN